MKAREYIRQNMNVPNVLTLIRLLLVPVYIALFAMGDRYAALTVFLLASLTDMLDGQIARKYGLVTDFGKLMDPLADKIMVVTAMFSMTIGSKAIPAVLPWPAVLILFVKETVMVIGSAVMLRLHVVVYATMVGKVAQCMFIASLVAVYFHEWFAQVCSGWLMTPDLMMVWMSILLTLLALAIYVTRCIRVIKQQDAADPDRDNQTSAE